MKKSVEIVKLTRSLFYFYFHAIKLMIFGIDNCIDTVCKIVKENSKSFVMKNNKPQVISQERLMNWKKESIESLQSLRSDVVTLLENLEEVC